MACNHSVISIRCVRQDCAEFVCYADVQSDDSTCHHFSLDLPQYVQFTSPIRRYMDIVVHRFVVAALDNQPAPYTADEVKIRVENFCLNGYRL